MTEFDMGLSYDYITGHADDVFILLRQFLGLLVSRGSNFKVGVTIDPGQRWSAHRQHGWREMVVVYHTTSPNYAGSIEDDLILHGWRSHFLARSWNAVRGGGGVVRDASHYYVYVLIA
jgi:hypothetical protein